jgi:eukaryotic-like serine/threonine-protein kinase
VSDRDLSDKLTKATVCAPPAGASEPTKQPGTVSVRERIVLRGLHSSGGIGEVWIAHDEVLGREIALKRLKDDQAESARNRARFFREARITGQLEHPGIVPVYDFSCGEDGRGCFYTMRFVRGRTLTEVIADIHDELGERELPLVSSGLLDLLGHFISVCNTVAFAHSRGVVHRDIKGDNVIIGDYGEVVVLDWGLAKRLGQADEDEDRDERDAEPAVRPSMAQHDVAHTMQGELLGTPAYMAPEQALGLIDCIDERTDVYGLAALLYEILTGAPPFEAAKLETVMLAIIEQSPVAPSQRVAGVPPELEQVCLRGLAKDRDARPPSVAALAQEVRAWLEALADRRRLEQERERFFDLSLDLLTIVDRKGALCQANAAWESLLGWTAEARTGAAFIEFVAPEHRAVAEATLAEVRAGAAVRELEVRMRAADHSARWVHWNLRSIPHEDALYLVGRDVSERKRSERELEGLLESAPDATCVLDESGVIVRVNAQLERLFGHDRDELIGQPVEMLVPDELRARHRGFVSRYIAAPEVRPIGVGRTLQGQHKNGAVFAVEISLSPVVTEQRVLIACTLREPSERRKIERQMLAVLDSAPDAMLVIDRQQRIMLINRRMEALFGYPRDELIGRDLELLIPPELRESHRKYMGRYLSDPTPRRMGVGRGFVGRHRDGRSVLVQISLSPISTDEGVLICGALRPVDSA